MKSIVSGQRLMKSFGAGSESRKVLDGVCVEIGAGEFVAVMGPSGSGKSTLLYALSGMDRADAGEVHFCGENLSAMGEDALAELRRTRMGFVFQQPTLLKNLNVLDNIVLPSMQGRKQGVVQLADKARRLMKAMGIAELEARDIAQVSGGQLQRVGICRALMNDPQIIFGDEPTGALNSKAANEVMDILSGIHARGSAIMLVTHDAKVAARAERVLLMCDGKIVSELRLPASGGRDMDERIRLVIGKMQEVGI